MAQGDHIVEPNQNESGHPIDLELVSELVRDAGLNKKGLIYDKVFKKVSSRGACDIAGIDYEKTFDSAGAETFKSKLDLLKTSDNEQTCTSEPKTIENPSFSRRNFQVKDYSNKVELTECCLNLCGMDAEKIVSDLKLNNLVDHFYLNKEAAGIDLLTGGTVGAWNAGYTDMPLADLTDCANDKTAEGKAIDMGGIMCDKTFDLQTVFQNLQSNFLLTGIRNKVVLSRKLLMALRRNDSLKHSGCSVAPTQTLDYLKAELGVDEVIIAEATSNIAAANVAFDMKHLWNKDFMLLFQSDSSVGSMDDPRTRQNFAVDIQKFSEYVRQFTKVESGHHGVDFLAHHYSYTPVVHNVKAGTLLHNF